MNRSAIKGKEKPGNLAAPGLFTSRKRRILSSGAWDAVAASRGVIIYFAILAWNVPARQLFKSSGKHK